MTAEDPTCPDCDAPMVRRQAKRGKNAGGYFYGCTRYPACRGTRDADAPSGSGSARARERGRGDEPALWPRVRWFDGTLQRSGWIAQHVPVGGGWRSFELSEGLAPLAEHTWVAASDVSAYEPADDDTLRVASMLRKLLQRGARAPLSPVAERLLLQRLDLPEAEQSAGDLAPAVDPRAAREFLESRGTVRPAELADALPYDSDEERLFHTKWVPELLGDDAARWVIPQASLGDLLRGRGSEEEHLFDARRVDFLVQRPKGDPFVVEIDGLQHREEAVVDAAREEALQGVGIETVRIEASEIRVGPGDGIAAFAAAWEAAGGHGIGAHAALAPAQVQRSILGIVTAIENGFLLGDRWVIELEDDLDVVASCLGAELRVLLAVDDLWGPGVAPKDLWLRTPDGVQHLVRRGLSYERDGAGQEPPPTDLRLVVEAGRSPVERLPERGQVPIVVVRPSVLPVGVQLAATTTTRRVPVKTDGAQTTEALRAILQSVFAKRDFREGQLEALLEILEGRDAVVLLPTGAGKSLIYQLAGLLLPGVTLIVDPIIALMEDQIRGLADHGIDRVMGLSSYLVQRGHGEEMLARVGAGDVHFAFISPERLQQPQFRSAITQMSATTMVNLAVVDEAHCVSEWGHDFRTAYLRLGPVLRRVCQDASGQPPPLLALTGTASRAVLRDVLFELEIDAGGSPNTLIRPRTFDRSELQFDIVVGEPDTAEARLKGYLQGLPGRMRRPPATFFRPDGRNTYSGIVFCPFVNGKNGVAAVADLIQPVVGQRPVLYSGGAPRQLGTGIDWEAVKRANAEEFKANQAPVLVATSSFGMGIDKPNIRWVIHYGIPSSIEAYYQEAGRGGRDGRPARCAIIFSELEEQRSRGLLDHDRDLEETRREHDEIGRGDADDVTRALWFLLNSFAGISANLNHLGQVIDEIGDFSRRRHVELPFSTAGLQRQDRERAIHRLVLLGAVYDYTVDWGSRSFGLQVAQITPEDIREQVLDFIGRTQPARVKAVAERLDASEWQTPRDALLACGRALVEFVYDTIERSRRRSMREMWLAARQGDGEVLRARILDYLTEGDAAPVLESLLDATEFRFRDWTSRLDDILLVNDAAEWRGSSARLLVSEPDHPGLLLTRAVTELRAPNGDLEEFKLNLTKALQSAPARYDVAEDELSVLADWLSDRAIRDSQRDARALIVAAFQDAGLTALAARLAQLHATDGDPTVADAAVYLSVALPNVNEDLDELIGALSAPAAIPSTDAQE